MWHMYVLLNEVHTCITGHEITKKHIIKFVLAFSRNASRIMYCAVLSDKCPSQNIMP